MRAVKLFWSTIQFGRCCLALLINFLSNSYRLLLKYPFIFLLLSEGLENVKMSARGTSRPSTGMSRLFPSRCSVEQLSNYERKSVSTRQKSVFVLIY